MKLRNKKTGEIKEIVVMPVEGGYPDEFQIVDGETSLKDFNEFWEDVEDINVPIIKDEKIRKAVRAWAEANSLTYVQYRNEELGGRFNGYDFEYICFNPWKDDSLKEYCDYTITELCGEEEK